MTVANLKTLLGSGSGGSFKLKAGQSWGACGIGTVATGALNVSTATDVISLTGKWAITSIEISCSASGTGTMTATLTVDGVSVLTAASVGTTAYIPLYGGLFTALGTGVVNNSQASQTPIVCNNSLTLTLQRTTADTVSVRYIALAIE